MRLTRADLVAFWINLDRATDRRAQMEPRLAALGLPMERFSAIDGRAEPARIAGALDDAAFRRNMGRTAIPAEVGCYLSHLGVWARFLQTGKPVALVLEDDVVFHADFLPALDAALAAADHWDMLKLNRIRAKLPIRLGRAGDWTLNAYLGPATGFGAYLITRDLATRLLPRILPVRMPVDYEGTRFWAHDFRLLGLEPWPSHVDDGGESTITGQGFAEVKKAPRWRRLGNYAMRAGNYGRRLGWLARHGLLHKGI
ncbi:MAG: glycosyltransferase family 25 protein [Gemmobacter sp.]